jgi:intracellular sulfur oxidation DsrE/DsrF family protein
MKTILLTLIAVLGLFAQDGLPKDGKKYHVIFEMSNGEQPRLEGVIRNIDNLKIALGAENVTVELVLHGGAIVSYTKDKTTLATEWERLAKSGVGLLACNNSLKMRNIPKDTLLPNIKVVDSAVAELVRKQQSGWQYIRNAN